MNTAAAALALVALAGLVPASALQSAAAAEPGTPHVGVVEPRMPAVADDAQAQYDRGLALLCGARRAGDAREAAGWMTLAAEQGHAGAQGMLGWMRMTGRGVARDDRLAARWLGRAADRGDTAAQNNLGVLYATGRGVGRDPAAAARWFTAAAEQGAEDAVRNLQVLRGRPATAAGGTPRATAHPALAAASCRTGQPASTRQP